MNQEQLDKIFEIKQLAIDIVCDDKQDEIDLDKIIRICEQIVIDHQINERLKECREWANWVVVPQDTHPDSGLFVCHKHVSLDDNTEEVIKFDGEIVCEYGK